jgi:diguanylate cyclase (GGDEF)-like protein
VIGLNLLVLVHKVRSDHRALEILALSDPLTGLWNRRAFDAAIEEEFARARRSEQPISLVYIDVDDFKRFNDRAGHAEGDRVLQHLCGLMVTVVRDRL